MTTLPSLLLALSPFVLFDSDYAIDFMSALSVEYTWSIFMILGRNMVEM